MLMQYQFSWIIQIFIIVLLTLAVDLLCKKGLVRLIQKAAQNRASWDDVLLRAIKKPLRLLIWVLGFGFALHIVSLENPIPLFGLVDPLRKTGVLVTIIWFLSRLISEGERQFVVQGGEREQTVDRTTVDAIAKLLRASVYITGFLVILQSMGYSVSGVLAFGGIGGIAIGFAARDLLANFFGSLMIYLDRPFNVGDWVRSPDKEIEGTVEHIGWRLTRIRTFDKRPLYVPNSLFNTIVLENPSRMTNRRIYETIGVRYQDAHRIPAIIDKVRDMLRNHEDIDQSATLIVNLNQCAPSALEFFVYTFTRTTNWVQFHAVKQKVMLQILEIVEVCGAECAFPTSTLHLPDPIRMGSECGTEHPQGKSG